MSLLGRHHWARTGAVPKNRDPWTCGTCGAPYVVQVLARDCERKHETEGGTAAEVKGSSA